MKHEIEFSPRGYSHLFETKIEEIELSIGLLIESNGVATVEGVLSMLHYEKSGIYAQIIVWVAENCGYIVGVEKSRGCPYLIFENGEK